MIKGEDDSVLYKRVQPHRAAPICLQIVLPQHLRKEVLDTLHAGFGGGHQGVARLEGMVRERFHWPGLQQDIKDYCRECAVCEKRRDPQPAPLAPLGSLQASAFLDRLDIDLVCGLPVTEQGGCR